MHVMNQWLLEQVTLEPNQRSKVYWALKQDCDESGTLKPDGVMNECLTEPSWNFDRCMFFLQGDETNQVQQTQPLEDTTLDDVWVLIEDLLKKNATHVQKRFRLRDLDFHSILNNLWEEIEELDDTLLDYEQENDEYYKGILRSETVGNLGDVLSLLITITQLLGVTPQELAESMVGKFTLKFK